MRPGCVVERCAQAVHRPEHLLRSMIGVFVGRLSTGYTPKVFRRGTHRLIAPDETVQRVLRLAPIMGITRIANVTGLDSIGVPVVMVCRPNSRSLAVSQGKGLDVSSARASGLMESVEQYHAETSTLPLRLCSYEELRYSHIVVPVEDLPMPALSYFHVNLRLLWCEGYDLVQDEDVFVPYEMVHTNYTWPLPTGSGCFAASSNGLASGNHRLEAISHGICEVVERDATTLWTLRDGNWQARTRVDLSTVDDPCCREILDKFDRGSINVAVWETTTDIGIPCFTCLIVPRSEDHVRHLSSAAGHGCHPARGVALLRALTEAAQSRLTQIAGSRDDSRRDNYEQLQDPQVLEGVRRRMQVTGAMRRFQEAASWEGETFEDDVGWELERLVQAGIHRVVVVDLTKPEFGLPITRVIIPGLEGSHRLRGYVPGRRARAVLEDGL